MRHNFDSICYAYFIIVLTTPIKSITQIKIIKTFSNILIYKFYTHDTKSF